VDPAEAFASAPHGLVAGGLGARAVTAVEVDQVLRGDLADVDLPAALAALADERATGCLHVAGPGGAAVLHLSGGALDAADVIGVLPIVGPRLVCLHGVPREALVEAQEAQAGALAGWRLGEILVHLGLVEPPFAEGAGVEEILDVVTTLAHSQQGSWDFRTDEPARPMVAQPLEVDEVLAHVEARRGEQLRLTEQLGPAPVVPRPAADGEVPAGVALAPATRAVLCAVDAVRDAELLAHACGLTRLETARALVALLDAGLVKVGPPDTALVVPPALAARSSWSALGALEALDDEDDIDDVSRVSAALAALLESDEDRTRDAPAPVWAEVVEPDAAAAEEAQPGATVVDLGAAREARDAEERLEAGRAHAEQLATEAADRARAQVAARAELAALQTGSWPAPDGAASEPTPDSAVASRPELVPAGPRSLPGPRDGALTAAGALAEFNASSPAVRDEPVGAAPAAEPEAVPPQRPPSAGLLSTGRRDPQADTASLLRELSSLGIDDAAPQAPPRAAPRPAVPASKDKKKKGLFGR